MYIINKDNYIGDSTTSEIEYAIEKEKKIEFMKIYWTCSGFPGFPCSFNPERICMECGRSEQQLRLLERTY